MRKSDPPATKGPTVKLNNYDGTIDAFLHQLKTCAKFYEWDDEQCAVQLQCVLSGDAAILIFAQPDVDQITYERLLKLLKDRYGASNQEEKFQAELSSRRRKPGEDFHLCVLILRG